MSKKVKNSRGRIIEHSIIEHLNRAKFYEKVLQKKNKAKDRLEKIIKRKGNKLYSN